MRKKLLWIAVGIILTFYSCSKDDNNSKVSVQEGYIKVTISDSTLIYKIDEITYAINNDTTTLEISALKENSNLDYIIVGLKNIVNLSEKSYDISTHFEDYPDSSSAYIYFFTANSPATLVNNGKISVLKYQYNNIFQASFNYTIIEQTDTTIANGEINLNFAHFDPARIPNVPLSPAKLRVNIDSIQHDFSCVASFLTNANRYILNGVKGDNNLVIEVNYLNPKPGKNYPMGVTIDSTGFIKLSYTDSTGTYLCDGKNNSTGTLSIAKITYNTFQGYFECKAYQTSNTKKIRTFSKGVFFARLKRVTN